jgi:hypothetical protein
MWSVTAALVKLPVSTTRAKALIASKRSIRSPGLFGLYKQYSLELAVYQPRSND